LPAEFSSLEQEYWAVRRSVGIFDFSFMSTVELSGSDNVTNDLKISPIDSSVTNWKTDTNPLGLAGTYLFPATFVLMMPKNNKNGWC
jgi:hypothetical protein